MKLRPDEDDEPTFSESAGIRYLHFGSEWIQGAMAVADPSRLVLEYTRQMMAWLLFVPPPKPPLAVAMLGLGAGSLARYCLAHLSVRVQAVEWNPQVIAACAYYFKLRASQRRLQIDCEDAALWVADPQRHGRCPALMVDLYDAQAQGPVRDSLAFYRDCRYVVGEDAGVVSVNLFGAHESFARNLNHLDQAFGGRVVLLPEIDAGNRVALAFTGTAGQLSGDELHANAEAVESAYGLPARRWAKSLRKQLC